MRVLRPNTRRPIAQRTKFQARHGVSRSANMASSCPEGKMLFESRIESVLFAGIASVSEPELHVNGVESGPLMGPQVSAAAVLPLTTSSNVRVPPPVTARRRTLKSRAVRSLFGESIFTPSSLATAVEAPLGEPKSIPFEVLFRPLMR